MTEPHLAAEAGVLAVPVAALALEVLLLHHLAGGLVLELVVLRYTGAGVVKLCDMLRCRFSTADMNIYRSALRVSKPRIEA